MSDPDPFSLKATRLIAPNSKRLIALETTRMIRGIQDSCPSGSNFAIGYDREELERFDMVPLGGPYDKVFTPGIWTRHQGRSTSS